MTAQIIELNPFQSPERERRYIRWSLSPALRAPLYGHLRDSARSVRSAHFSTHGHRAIWEAVESELARCGHLFLADLKKAVLSDPRYGKAAVSLLSDLTFESVSDSPGEVPADVGELEALATEIRSLYEKSTLLKAWRHGAQSAAEDNREGTERALAVITQTSRDGAVVSMETDENIGQVYLSYEERKSRTRTLQKTGFQLLDDAIGDLGQQSCWIVGGTTGAGKSSIALSAAMHMAHQGIRGGWISLEDSSAVVGKRLAAIECHIDISDSRELGDLEVHAIGNYLKRNGDNKLVRFTYPLNLGMSEVLGGIDMLADDGARFVVVDYLQAIYMPAGLDRRNFIRDAVARMKAKCAARDVNLILLSQISRGETPFAEPYNSKLKESGDIEDKAEIITLMWKDGDGDEASTFIKTTKVKWSGKRPRGKIVRDHLGSIVNIEEIKKPQPAAPEEPFVPFARKKAVQP